MRVSSRQRQFDALVRAHSGDLYRYAYWLCGDSALAQDLTQEAFLRAWLSLDSLRETDAAKAWLITILRREHARLYERKSFDTTDISELELDDREASEAFGDPVHLPDGAEQDSRRHYFRELFRLQGELVRLQSWVAATGHKLVILFEGRDAAGKGGVIKRITQRLNPRVCRVAALPAPNDRERTQWYFQRYAAHLPAAGEIVLFDRSWYNRAGVEHVMGFCTPREYDDFMRQVPEFERHLVSSGIHLFKFWFSVSQSEQRRRFDERKLHPLKQWKLSPVDLASLDKWEAYTKAKEAMFAHTDTADSP